MSGLANSGGGNSEAGASIYGIPDIGCCSGCGRPAKWKSE